MVLENDAVLPSQFVPARRQPRERNLLRAMIEDAFSCLRFPETEFGIEAMRWFESSRSTWGSCAFICDELGFEIDGVRRYARSVFSGRVTYRRINHVTWREVSTRPRYRRRRSKRMSREA